MRFILGICEGAITAGFLIVTSMFYTRAEQTLRVGYWCKSLTFESDERTYKLMVLTLCFSIVLMNGVAVILLGFVAFGVLHTHTHKFEPWQWYACPPLPLILPTSSLCDTPKLLVTDSLPLKISTLLRFMIITGIITLLTAVAFWFLFPDSPTNAWFLNPDERRLAVLRIKVNQTGVENKHWKYDQ